MMSLAIAAVIVVIGIALSGVAAWVSLRTGRYLVPFALLVGGGLIALAFTLIARITADGWFAFPMTAGYSIAAGALLATLFSTWIDWRCSTTG